MKKSLPTLALSLLLSGCAGITSTQRSPDGTVTTVSISSSMAKQTLRNLKSPQLSIGSIGQDLSAQIEPLVQAISAGVANGMAANAARERALREAPPIPQ